MISTAIQKFFLLELGALVLPQNYREEQNDSDDS
jgi:hypothetical protein